MFEQTFKNIDDILHKDAGCTSELDYTEQSSWLLFLKYLDALETDKALEAALEGKKYKAILDADYRWESWAAPKTADGKLDHNNALTGDDLLQFVNGKLFPYLHGFKQRATGPDTIEYKIGEIFGEIKNRIQSGYNLREVIELVDELRFGSQAEKHELSHLYEAKIKNMGNAGRNGGEYYTPRPLIRAMIQVTAPQIGERIYDGAVGSAGFLCEAFDYLSAKPKGWVERRLREVAVEFGRGKSKHRPRNDPKLYGGPYPFIQTGDVRGSNHLITDFSQTYSQAGLKQSKLWPKGTLCITIAANIAETGILDFNACFPDSVIGVVVNETMTSTKFLEYLLQSFKAVLQAQGKGSAQDNINLATFEQQLFPFPPVHRQAAITESLDALAEETQRLESIYQQKLSALDELKKSLLHQAFSGAL